MSKPTVVLGMSEANPSVIVNFLNRNNGAINRLYDPAFCRQASRVSAYIQEAPLGTVFPSAGAHVLKRATQGAACMAVVGAIGGSAIPGAGTAAGAAGGAIAGALAGSVVGIIEAVKMQETQYGNWLKDRRNQDINDQVLKIVHDAIGRAAANDDDSFKHFLDPFKRTFMRRPVMDPVTGIICDYYVAKEL